MPPVIPVNLTGLVDNTLGDALDVVLPMSDIVLAEDKTLAGDPGYNFDKTLLVASTLLTINGSDTITATQTLHRINNAASAASDNLTTVSSGLDVVVLYQNNSGQTTTVKHGTGNIYFEDEQDYALAGPNGILVLVKQEDTGNYFALTPGKTEGFKGAIFALTNNQDVSVGPVSSTLLIYAAFSFLFPSSGSSGQASIIGTIGTQLDVMVLALKNPSTTITLLHNTSISPSANAIRTPSASNIVMSDRNRIVVLVRNNTTGEWNPLLTNRTATMSAQDEERTATTLTGLLTKPRLSTLVSTGRRSLDLFPKPNLCRPVLSHAYAATFASLGASFGSTGTLTNDARDSGDFTRITQPNSVSSFAIRQTSDTLFQWRWNPQAEARFVLSPFTGTNPSTAAPYPIIFGFLTGMPTYSAGNLSWAGVSGFVLWQPFGFSLQIAVINSGAPQASAVLGSNYSLDGATVMHAKIAADSTTNIIRASMSVSGYVPGFAFQHAISAPAWASTPLNFFLAYGSTTAAGVYMALNSLYLEQN
jgi:hypothetical protein